MAKQIDWMKSCSYDAAQKAAFHKAAKGRLKELATALDLKPGTYEIRSNQGGIAVSGEVTLHHDEVYIQAAQSAMGGDRGLMIRSCKGRKDFSGGPNNFESLRMLDQPSELAERVKRIVPAVNGIGGIDPDELLVNRYGP